MSGEQADRHTGVTAESAHKSFVVKMWVYRPQADWQLQVVWKAVTAENWSVDSTAAL